MFKWTVLFLLLLPSFGHAQDVNQFDSRPHEIAADIHAMAPYGTGAFSFFGVEIYNASLWTDAHTWSMQSVFALSLHYEIDISSEEFVDGSIEQMVKQAPLAPREDVLYRRILATLLQPVTDGDTLTTLYVPGQSLRFYHNGQLTGVTTNMIFARRFLNIWFSPQTSWPILRHQLVDAHEAVSP